LQFHEKAEQRTDEQVGALKNEDREEPTAFKITLPISPKNKFINVRNQINQIVTNISSMGYVS